MLTWLYLGQPTRALQALTAISDAAAVQAPATCDRRHHIEARIDRALGKPMRRRLEQALLLLYSQTDPVLRSLAELDSNRESDPAVALSACQRLQNEAEQQELLAVAMRARLFAVDALRRAGDFAMAAHSARQVMNDWHACRPADIYWPEALRMVYQAFRGAGDEETASSVLKEAVDWIADIARSHVPEPFRDSFLQRNVVNRDVLAEAGRCAAAATG